MSDIFDIRQHTEEITVALNNLKHDLYQMTSLQEQLARKEDELLFIQADCKVLRESNIELIGKLADAGVLLVELSDAHEATKAQLAEAVGLLKRLATEGLLWWPDTTRDSYMKCPFCRNHPDHEDNCIIKMAGTFLAKYDQEGTE